MSKPQVYKIRDDWLGDDSDTPWVMECCGGWPSCCHHRAYPNWTTAMFEAEAHLRCEHKEMHG